MIGNTWDRPPCRHLCTWMVLVLLGTTTDLRAEERAVALPPGVKAVWDLDRAAREETSTKEQICINGLWRWQPAARGDKQVPEANWGYFKVPGSWPGITDYMQKDSQTVHSHPSWKDARLGGITAAWYEREIRVPEHWNGRRVTLSLETLNSYAAVYLDGRPVGEVRFPAGEVDITPWCRPGETQVLSLVVEAFPLKGVLLSYQDTASAREVEGRVARRGLCGDVYLVGSPPRERIVETIVETSVRARVSRSRPDSTAWRRIGPARCTLGSSRRTARSPTFAVSRSRSTT